MKHLLKKYITDAFLENKVVESQLKNVKEPETVHYIN